MLRLSSSLLCPFCEARALGKTRAPSWQSTRTAATLQKRKPSRMTLASNVTRGAVPSTASGKPERKSRNTPFGAMNLTAVPRDLARERASPSSAEQRRSANPSKHSPTRRGKGGARDAMHALKMQRALSNISYEKRNRVKTAMMQHDSFADFDLLPVVQESIATQALVGMLHVTPTPVQRLALPALLGMEDRRARRVGGRAEGMQQFLLAAETGSGKTLAYLLPVIDAIKRAEAGERAAQAAQAAQAAKEEQQKRREKNNKMFALEPPPSNEPDADTARPQAIILVPTSELVEQVGHLVKNLSHTVKYRSALLSAHYTGKMIRSRLFTTAGIDVVVTTPHLLLSITESDPNILSRVTHLVIDEADSLLDRSFAPTTSSIIDRATPSLKQLIFCSATIPRSLDRFLHARYPDVSRLVTPNLHAIPRRVQLSVVDIEKLPYHGNRDLACAQVIWDIGKEAAEQEEGRERKIVVFVNERERTVELAEYLRKKGIDAVALSRDSQERKENDVLASFTGLRAPSTSSTAPATTFRPSGETAISPADLPMQPHPRSKPPPATSRSLPNTKVLVVTDLASRGIDTLPVRNVILYDVPHTSIDFIHRLGRVGRMNRRGRGVVLVGKGDRRDVVREVREGMFRGAALI